MTNEEALHLIDEYNILDKEFPSCAEALELAKHVLALSIAKEPKNMALDHFGQFKVVPVGVCPNCWTRVSLGMNFCFRCGQAIKWEEEK